MSYIEIDHVTKTFGLNNVVQDVSFAIERGEFVSFLGPSGCGKTTILRMIAGFETATKGRITIAGRDVTHLPPAQRDVGMVFQAYALFPNMTVAQNIAFGLKVKGKPTGDIKARVGEMLDLIKLEDKADRYPYQLSGGQQQRVALARALAVHPKVLLLDEPLSALDAKIRVSLRDEIRAVQRKLGITTIFVTHDQEEAMAISDRIVVLNQGRIEQAGAPHEIYNAPRSQFVARFVGAMNVIPARVSDTETGTFELLGQRIGAEAGFATPPFDEAYEVMIRPELLRLEARPGDIAVSGIVKEVHFLGAIIRIAIAAGSDELTADLFNDPTRQPPFVGAPITVHFNRQDARVMRTPRPPN